MVSSKDSCEVILQAAISDLNNGVFTSIWACAKAYNVPRSTLSDRLAYCPTRSIARQQQQRLSLEQEDFIAAWIIMEDLAGCLPTHARV
jgi:predicted kinase